MSAALARLDSTAGRPLSLQMRRDLVVSEQRLGLSRRWTIKDPVSLRYCQLRDEEFAILQMLDGRISLDELRQRYETAFAPRRVSIGRLQAFLRRLHQQGLVISDAALQGEQLLARREKTRRQARWGMLFSLLALRFRGVDPDRWLDRLYPLLRWLFSPAVATGAVLLVLAAVLLAVVQFDELRFRLPGFQEFFSARNLVWLSLSLAATKIVHELGHALTLKHFGGECHELGLMLLVFTPCLYCNVSDSWMLPGKWQRIAVAGAGIAVELVLAALATFLWWISQPGLFNLLCLNVMVLCSASTLLFNGNPLLKYDGYFVLSDWIDVPNLQQQSSAALRSLLARWCLGVSDDRYRRMVDGRPALLAGYAVVSGLYRWVLVGAILWFLHRVLEPYRLEIIVVVLGVLALFGLLASPVMAAARFAGDGAQRRRVHRGRLVLTGILLALAAVVVGMIPLPRTVAGPAVVEPLGAQPVYVTVPGRLIEAASAGENVKAGEVLARLGNLPLEREIEELAGEYALQRLHVENLESRRIDDPEAAAAIPAARTALQDLEERLARRRDDQQRLTLRAPANGTVLPPPNVLPDVAAAGALPTWSGTPLDAINRGAWLEETLFCLVGDPERLEVVVVLDEADVEFVREGQTAWIRLDQTPGASLEGRVIEVAKVDLQVTPRELADGREIAVRKDQNGVARPLDVYYQARLRLQSSARQILIGGRGRARIEVETETLARRLSRFVQQTFRFRL